MERLSKSKHRCQTCGLWWEHSECVSGIIDGGFCPQHCGRLENEHLNSDTDRWQYVEEEDSFNAYVANVRMGLYDKA